MGSGPGDASSTSAMTEMGNAAGTSAEAASWEALGERVTISMRPIGAPLPLGFYGLAAASLVVSGLQLGWIDVTEGRAVAFVLIGFTFVAQLTAAIFAFLARDGTAATAMGVLASTWLVVGLVDLTSAPGATSGGLGLFLLFSGTAMALSGLTTALGKVVPAGVFLVAAVRFVVTGVYELSATSGWKHAAGLVGVVLFALAMYAGWAAAL